LGDGSKWWAAWRDFMFKAKHTLPGKKGGAPSTRATYELLGPIKHAKYPDITEEEEVL
jgi:hypothetical protein